jgi:hypothetical protein
MCGLVLVPRNMLNSYDEGAARRFLFDLGDPGFGDDVPILHHLVHQECPGHVELEPDRYGADFFESDPYCGIFQRFVECGVQSF